MMKFLLTLLLATATSITFAQSFNIGIKGGVNLSSLSLSGISYKPDAGNITGFHAGIVADIGFLDFSIQPGLFYITKGQKVTAQLMDQNQQSAGTLTTKTKLNYLELPVNLLYKIHAAPGVKVYLGGGPYLGYGLSGSFDASASPAAGVPTHADLSFGSDSTKTYNNPDYGVNFIAGVELIKRFTIDLNYSLGLGNLAKPEGIKFQNRSMGLSVGYWFR